VGVSGNDNLVGGSGNDYLDGSGRSDEIFGTDLTYGTGAVDRLTGGTGTDCFNLWSESGRSGIHFYYNDSNFTTAGLGDYALITDFDPKKDVINLTSFDGMNADITSVNYILGASPSGLPAGTGLFVDDPGNGPNELIAILQGVSPDSLSLSAPYFSYYTF
jgi:Ca2+-binding RTX toxin-like protein